MYVSLDEIRVAIATELDCLQHMVDSQVNPDANRAAYATAHGVRMARESVQSRLDDPMISDDVECFAANLLQQYRTKAASGTAMPHELHYLWNLLEVLVSELGLDEWWEHVADNPPPGYTSRGWSGV